MGMLDCPSTNRFWKFSFCAKEDGLFSAELQVASPGQTEKKGILSFFKRRRSYKEEGGMCDVSLRIRAHLFFLKAKVAAGRLCEMRLQTRQGSSKKLTLLDFNSSVKSAPPSPHRFQMFQRSSSSPASGGSSSLLSRILFARKKRKESLFVCGACIGALTLFLLHHARACATHFPAFALNAGSRLVSFLAKSVQKKCNTTGSKKGAACFMQWIQRAASLFQMVMSLLRSTFVGNCFVTAVLLAILIGVILAAGKADKLQNLQDRKKQRSTRLLRTRLAMKLLLVMQLLKRFWEHIGMKQAFLFVLLLAFLSSVVSRVQAFS